MYSGIQKYISEKIMGIRIFKLSSSCYETPKPAGLVFDSPVRGNPNPENFEILRIESIGNYLVVKVHYPDCTNYEGNKIMVYKDVTIKELAEATVLDPHFYKSKGIKSPVARFEPTEEGWNMATFFCRHYTGKTY
jgi:hypothetical protein